MNRTNFFSTLLLIFLPSISCSLQGMEGAIEEKPASVSVKNSSQSKLDVTYKMSNQKPTPLTLEVGEAVILPGPLSSLEELYVEPYGKVKGWLSTSVLTRGYIKGTNVANLDQVKRAQKENVSIRISIKPGGESVEGVIGKGFLSDIASAVSPYTYDITSIKRKKTGEVTVTLFDQFPQILKASELSKPFLPRYVLGIGENADASAINAAYDRLRAHWEPKTKSVHGQEAALAQKVLEFANEARKNLLNEDNTFENMTTENYFYTVPEQELEEQNLAFALDVKEFERNQKNRSPEELAARRAAMEEIGFVFNESETK